MIEFVCTPLPVRIAQHGCHCCHAFSHSQNEFMFGNIFFSHSGVEGGQGYNLAPMKICHGVQGRSNYILWYRVPHFSANLRNCLPGGYSVAHSTFVYQPIF